MKKILVSSDLHCDQSAAAQIVRLSNDVDLAIVAGDFANQHRRIEISVDVLKDVSCPLIAVPGNNETLEELQNAFGECESVFVLHGSSVDIDGIRLFGIGGGIPVTPFGSWSFDLTENQAAELLSNCEQPDILISHSPPLGHVDRSATRDNLGSSAVLDAIVRTEPQLVVCGHIHESWGTDSVFGTTRIMNAGPEPILVELKKRLNRR